MLDVEDDFVDPSEIEMNNNQSKVIESVDSSELKQLLE